SCLTFHTEGSFGPHLESFFRYTFATVRTDPIAAVGEPLLRLLDLIRLLLEDGIGRVAQLALVDVVRDVGGVLVHNAELARLLALIPRINHVGALANPLDLGGLLGERLGQCWLLPGHGGLPTRVSLG